MDMLMIGLRLFAAAVFVVALVWAAVSDIRTFEVPNAVPVVIVAAFPLLALADGIGWETFGVHVLAAAAVLVFGFILFSVRVMGAGDAKLLAAISLWIGWPVLVPYLFYVALTGGSFALALILLRRGTLSDRLSAIDWVRRLHERTKDIPYAVAIVSPAPFLVFGTGLQPV